MCLFFVCLLKCCWHSLAFNKRIIPGITKQDAPTLRTETKRGVGELHCTVNATTLSRLLPSLRLRYARGIGPATLACTERGDVHHRFFVCLGSYQCPANLHERMAGDAYTRLSGTQCAAHACTVYYDFCHNFSFIYLFLPSLLSFFFVLFLFCPSFFFFNS